ncbi:MAG: TetR/AcrR family transcriptional regulator [Muribaculaceae bacterium]|nr:TetR/AcrR family transcriptional regulator [Muribaculaceae bacterium]
MVSKTRERFIEVARQLFARKGVENTTMNDIASASDKGRRTIYTYFKSKREIFNAVIASETEELLSRLKKVVAKNISPQEKLVEYIDCRFETMSEIVSRNGSLRAGFFRDVRKVDRARKLITDKESMLLREILKEGVEQNVFVIDDLNAASLVITHTLHGLDVPYVRDNISKEGVAPNQLKKYITHLILFGIECKKDDKKEDIVTVTV